MPLITLPFIILAVLAGFLGGAGKWLFHKIFGDDDKKDKEDKDA